MTLIIAVWRENQPDELLIFECYSFECESIENTTRTQLYEEEGQKSQIVWN